MDTETLTLALKSLPLDVRLSKNTVEGFKRVLRSRCCCRRSAFPQAFDPAPSIDNRSWPRR